METINNFLENNYIIFAIASLFLLFAVIGYFMESKKSAYQFKKEDELNTINIQDQVNQMNNNGTSQTQTVETLTMETQPTQVTEQVQQTQTTTQNAPTPEQNSETNIEILG